MAPVLLDNRGLFKVGISMLLALVLVFGGGFMTGYQKAIVQHAELTQNRGINLPLIDTEQAETLAMALAPQPPATEEAGASIDVDKPDLVSSQMQKSLKQTSTAVVKANLETVGLNKTDENLAVKSQIAKQDKSETATADIISLDKSLAKSTEKTLKEELTKASHSEAKLNALVEVPDLSSEIIEVSKLTARYSIQVGMYGRRVNASNFVRLLEAQGLNAYISEYLNKQQQLRYNVRFGYFENKHTALKGLKHYREHMDGKGYLVRLKQTMHAENNRSASSVPTDKTAQF